MKTDKSGQGRKVGGLLINLSDWARNGNIYLVSLAPVLLGLVVLIAALSQMDMTSVQQDEAVAIRLVAALGVAMMGLSGVIQAWRKEVPGPLGGSFRGGVAAVFGWIWALAFWATAVVSLFV